MQHSPQTEYLTLLSNAFTIIPFNQMLGLKLDHLDFKSVSMSFAMKEELIGNFLQRILHGGVISSVLDMAGGMVVMASMIEKHANHTKEELAKIIGNTSTVDLQVSFLRPGRSDYFTAKASLLKSGKKISFAHMELINEDDNLIATGTGTYLT